MLHLGAPELLILLAIVLILFGAGRIGRLSGELGASIRNFRNALKDENKPDNPAG